MSPNQKWFAVLSGDKILAEKVKTFPCLHDKSGRLYRDRGIVRNAWLEVSKKLEFLKDDKCC